MKKYYLKKLILFVALVPMVVGQSVALAHDRPKIQMAILLDGSGSMQGLTNQARKELWKIVNELGKATRGGVVPKLEIAVYEHGKATLPAESGYLQQLVPLVSDLDTVTDKLFGITASGSEEFTGWAIQSATVELHWSDNPDDYKAIFIAGNETMVQGPIEVAKAIEKAVEQGIIVNTILANDGSFDAGAGFWIEAARIGKGRFAEIVLDNVLPSITTPLDDELISLNEDLNNTYVPFGSSGLAEYEKLLRNDENSLESDSFTDRFVMKSGVYYNEYVTNWDLVAAALAYEGGIEAFLLTLDEGDFTKEMQEMTLKEKVQHIEDKAFEREVIQEALVSLGKIRQKIYDRELEKLKVSGVSSFEKVMIAALHKQLEDKGFEINEEEVEGAEEQ